MTLCANCQFEAPADGYELTRRNSHYEYCNDLEIPLCSLDCVCEYAWKLREAQPKLSKSNVHTS